MSSGISFSPNPSRRRLGVPMNLTRQLGVENEERVRVEIDKAAEWRMKNEAAAVFVKMRKSTTAKHKDSEDEVDEDFVSNIDGKATSGQMWH
ncbi:hypothetical protein QQ045_023152 [Rhodiola kirilowii]